MRTGEVYGTKRLSDGRLATLRALKGDDLDSLLQFANELVKERGRNPTLGILMDRRPPRKEEEAYLSRMLKGIRTNDIASVAAVMGGRIVGNSEVQRMRSGDRHHVGLLGIAILDGYRGAGLGRLMLAALLSRAEKLGIRLVILEAFGTNDRALRLYESFGFRVYGRVPRSILRGGRYTDSVYMFRQG